MSWSQVANTYQEGLNNFLNMALGITQQKQQARQNTLDEAISRILNNEYFDPNAEQGRIGRILEDFGIETKNTKAAKLNQQLQNIDRERYGTDFTEFLGEEDYKTKGAERYENFSNALKERKANAKSNAKPNKPFQPMNGIGGRIPLKDPPAKNNAIQSDSKKVRNVPNEAFLKMLQGQNMGVDPTNVKGAELLKQLQNEAVINRLKK